MEGYVFLDSEKNTLLFFARRLSRALQLSRSLFQTLDSPHQFWTGALVRDQDEPESVDFQMFEDCAAA